MDGIGGSIALIGPMPLKGSLTFRAISCPRCGERFYICSPCYRGHKYCSQPCRKQARLQQSREANRRYRQSREARLDHRDRQRNYRRLKNSVGDQSSNGTPTNAMIGPPPIPEVVATAAQAVEAVPARAKPGVPSVRWAVPRQVRGLIHCRICGRLGEFIDISTS